jgi:hypothetical protein
VRRPTTVLVAALLAAACSTGSPGGDAPTVDDRDATLARVTAAVADVADAQAAADPGIATALAAVRELDVAVSRLRDPETVDDAVGRWPRVDAAVAGVELAPLRPALRDTAFAVDRARVALGRASEDAVDPRESDYLQAQDETLVAMRDYAAAADALVQVLQRHWPTYEQIAGVTGTFVEDRWLFRDAEEAVAAYEVAVSPHRAELTLAQEEIARFRDARDEAADAVNDASRRAAEQFRSGRQETP